MSDFLSRIVADRQADIATAKASVGIDRLRALSRSMPPARDFRVPFLEPGVQLIAELKRVSPSKGALNESADPAQIAEAFASGGAAAISVLTEPRHFHGSLDDLATVRRVAPRMPTLRKDFLIDPFQVWEGRAAGADAVLIIVAIVDDAMMSDLLDASRQAGVAALVEVNNEVETERAVAAGAEIIGINNRNLRTFETDIRTTQRLRRLIPPDRTVLSLSAISTEADVELLSSWGVDGMLVGEALMRSGDPRARVEEIVSWGRRPVMRQQG